MHEGTEEISKPPSSNSGHSIFHISDFLCDCFLYDFSSFLKGTSCNICGASPKKSGFLWHVFGNKSNNFNFSHFFSRAQATITN